MKNTTPNRRIANDTHQYDTNSKSQLDQSKNTQIATQQGYTEFFSWGNDENGQLGHGQEDVNRKKIFNLPKSLSFEVLISQVSCGFSHTAFISSKQFVIQQQIEQGYVFSFGSNTDGQLGVNDHAIKYSTAPLLVSDLISMQTTPVQISCGGYHTAVLTAVGEVYLWGRNLQGQCARSINYNQFLFTPHKLHTDTPNKLFRSVDCGDQHTAVISKTGELYTFGDNSEGQLGLGIEFKNSIDRAALVTGISEEALQVSCGFRHTLVLTDQGTVFCMGSNKKFELGNLNLQKSSQPIRVKTLEMFKIEKVIAGGFSVAITNTRELVIWGTGDFGVIQQPQKIFVEEAQFIDVSVSKNMDPFAAAIDTNGFVYTWGGNQFGQLGQGDFRLRKIPSKIPQLRKKKVRQIICGGGFVVALGKDVPEGSKQKHIKNKPSNQESQFTEQISARSRSQVTFGGRSQNGQQSSLRRKKNNEIDKSHLTTITDQNPRSTIQINNDSRSLHHSQENNRYSPSRYQRDQIPSKQQYQSQNLDLLQAENSRTIQELSVERQKRVYLEREVKDKEYELQNMKQQSQIVTDLQQQLLMYRKENEIMRDGLEKEQQNSFKLVSDVHKTISDNKLLREALDDKQREIHLLQVENQRHVEKAREVEYENDKLKQNTLYTQQKNEEEILRLRSMLNECEDTIAHQKNHVCDLERQLLNKIEQQKSSDLKFEKLLVDNAESKKLVIAMSEKINQLEFQVDTQQKENDDLKYDNTLLYDKNVQKDERIIQLNNQVEDQKAHTEKERSRVNAGEKDNQYLQSRIKDLEDQLLMQQSKADQRDKNIEELIRETDRLRRELENQIAQRDISNDNLKRAFDEKHYENENLRHSLNAKQDEIGSLNRIIQQQTENNSELADTIRQMENTIKDVEEKNKKLVDLLNSSMYNKAEQYKERVINKLQERTPGTAYTPNKTSGGGSIINPMHMNTDVSDFRNEPQTINSEKNLPSPLRLKKIIAEEQDQIIKDKERLMKMAESLTKSHDLTRSQGASSSSQNDYQNFRQNLQRFTSPFSNQNEQSHQNRSVHFDERLNLNSRFSGLTQSEINPQNETINARLRQSDLGSFGNIPSLNPRANDHSPERIADILKQSSPLRQKLALDSLLNRSNLDDSRVNDYTPNKSSQKRSQFDEDNGGNMTASKITHVSQYIKSNQLQKLLSSELEDLKMKMQLQQQEKDDLQERLQKYESNKLRQ